MNDMQKKLLLGQIRVALNDRYLSKVSDATKIAKPTLYKIKAGNENIYSSTVHRLCDYLNIGIPKQ